MNRRWILGASAVLVSMGIVRAGDAPLPQMKEGFWEWHTTQLVEGRKTETSMKICQSHEQEKAIQSANEAVKNACTSTTTRDSPGVYTSQTHCTTGPLAGASSKVKMTYHGDTGYHAEAHVIRTGSEQVTIMDSRYLGICPTGMKPGDAVLADGTKFNMGGGN
jgi:hypothetical protein